MHEAAIHLAKKKMQPFLYVGQNKELAVGSQIEIRFIRDLRLIREMHYRKDRECGVRPPGNSLALSNDEREVLPLLALARLTVDDVRLLDSLPRHLPPQQHRQRNHPVAVGCRHLAATKLRSARWEKETPSGEISRASSLEQGRRGRRNRIGSDRLGSDSKTKFLFYFFQFLSRNSHEAAVTEGGRTDDVSEADRSSIPPTLTCAAIRIAKLPARQSLNYYYYYYF